MIEDMTDWKEVKEGECFTTGILDSNRISCSEINTNVYYIDKNGTEWDIEEMEDGPPIMVIRSFSE